LASSRSCSRSPKPETTARRLPVQPQLHRLQRYRQQFPRKALGHGVYLSVPLFDGFQTKGKVIQAQSRLSTSRYELDRLMDNIALDARQPSTGSMRRQDRRASSTTSQAERLLEMAETGYRHGVKTKLEVDDAESNLLAARTNLLKARRDYIRHASGYSGSWAKSCKALSSTRDLEAPAEFVAGLRAGTFRSLCPRQPADGRTPSCSPLPA